MFRKLSFTLLALACCLSNVDAQMLAHLKKEVQKIIYYDTGIDNEKIPGFVIAIQLGDSTYVWGNGTLNKNTAAQPDENTVFELGGFTKVFTSSLVNLLVEEGQLSYDSSLNSYLPIDYRNPFAQQLTIRDLVQHTSGLPKMPFEFGLKEKEVNNPYAHYTQKDLLTFYAQYFIEVDEKEPKQFLYSHANYALLEYVIEQVSGQAFEALLNEKVLTPLQMKDTWIDQQNPARPLVISNGHSLSGDPTPMWTFRSFKASEGLKSNATDLLKFMQANIGLQDTPLSQSFVQNHVPAVDTKMRHQTYGGNGWHIMKMKKYHNIVLHAGTTDGHRAFMGFVKETKTGVLLLSNSELGMSGLGILILRMINHNWKKKKNGKR